MKKSLGATALGPVGRDLYFSKNYKVIGIDNKIGIIF